MKLNSAQIERALSQFHAMALPDNHPVVPQLSDLFGDHTFFINDDGLHIVEPIKPHEDEVQAVRVINVANWRDANQTGLELHDPKATDAIVEIESKH